MNNFVYHNPTKLVFGKGQIAQLAKLIPAGKKIMITCGGGSVRRNGIYDQVVKALEGRDWVEFWGIEPNPSVETCLLYTSPSPRDGLLSRMPSSA